MLTFAKHSAVYFRAIARQSRHGTHINTDTSSPVTPYLPPPPPPHTHTFIYFFNHYIALLFRLFEPEQTSTYISYHWDKIFRPCYRKIGIINNNINCLLCLPSQWLKKNTSCLLHLYNWDESLLKVPRTNLAHHSVIVFDILLLLQLYEG